MNIYIKPVFIAVLIVAAFAAHTQVPHTPSPTRVASEANSAQRETENVIETVKAVNDVAKALNDVKKMIDSIVANDKSQTAGEVHLIFVGINYNDENLAPVEEALKNQKGVTDVKKVQKTATVTFEMKSSLVPFDIWKDLPKKLQKSFIVHDKDPYNVVLLYKPPPKTKN